MLATFVLTSFDDRRVTDDQIAAWAVRLGPVSSSARGVRVVDGAFEWQLTIEEIPGGSNVKLEVFSSTQGPTMSAAVLERVGDLYRSTGARLGVGAADEVDVVSDASRVSRGVGHHRRHADRLGA